MAGLVMLTVRASDADSLVTRLFRKSGAPPSHANVVARHLVESSQLGVHSHGLIRVPQYVHEIRSGHLDPRAKPRRLGRHGAVSWVSGNSGFGQVGAIYSALAATASARKYGVGLVIAKNLGHTGRLGAYAELVANERCVAVLFGNGPPSSHLVAPFGGIDGRLATNPIAFAIPNGPTPVVADFSTSAMPEGKLRVARNVGGRLPPGVLQDPFGNATDDPGVLYGQPRGTLLPLGGPTFGHKGYALAILVEAMSTLLAGDETDDRSRVGQTWRSSPSRPGAASSKPRKEWPGTFVRRGRPIPKGPCWFLAIPSALRASIRWFPWIAALGTRLGASPESYTSKCPFPSTSDLVRQTSPGISSLAAATMRPEAASNSLVSLWSASMTKPIRYHWSATSAEPHMIPAATPLARAASMISSMSRRCFGSLAS